MTEEVKTKFKGPGEWRRQAARLEAESKGEGPKPSMKERIRDLKDESTS